MPPAAVGHDAGGAKAATTQASTAPSGKPAGDAHGGHAAAPAAPVALPVNPEWVDPNEGTNDAAKIRPIAQAPAGLAPKVVAASHGAHDQHALDQEYQELSRIDKNRTSTFFQIYFMMTGLHGFHVVVGMALIFWILVRSFPKPSRRAVGMAGLASLGVFFVYVGMLVHNHPSWIIGVVILIASGVGLFVLKPAIAATSSVVTAHGAAAAAGDFGPHYFTPVDIVGLYWHLVDLIWIFLFPLLYLIH